MWAAPSTLWVRLTVVACRQSDCRSVEDITKHIINSYYFYIQQNRLRKQARRIY